MNKMFKITGNEQDFPDFRQFHQLSSEFLPFAQKKLGFNKPVDINLVSDPENAEDPLGKTAYYDPNIMKITLFVDKRHVKDILRSLSHELVHHTQNCRGDFRNGVNIGEGNFTTNEALRELELEAYTEGSGATLREFEDYKKSMNESNSYLLNDSYLLKEKRHMSSVNETKLRKYVTSLIKDVLSEDGSAETTVTSTGTEPDPEGDDTSESKELEEEVIEEEGNCPKCECPKCECPPKKKSKKKKYDFMKGVKKLKPQALEPGISGKKEPAVTVAENWLKGNKDQLLFEELVKKWAK